MEQNNFNELNNINPSEYNKSPDELNVIEIANENQYYDNRLVEKKSNKNKNKKINTFKLIASFIVVCAVAAIVQTAFPIPIFSRLFSPAIMIDKTTYSFSSIEITDEMITFSLSIKNADFKNNNYFIYLVEQNNATEEYIKSISGTLKSIEQVKITASESTYNFTKYITTSGAKKIKPDTTYTIILLNNEKILQTYDVTTPKKVYISEMSVLFYGGNINVTMEADSSFTDFVILIQITNLSDPTWGAQGNGTDQTTCNDVSLSGSIFSFPVIKSLTPQYFEVKIYCRTTDPEKKALPDTVTHGDIENPEYYYLIYTYDKPITY